MDIKKFNARHRERRLMLQGLLDQEVFFASLGYALNQGEVLKLDAETGIPDAETCNAHEDALLDLALKSYARVQSEVLQEREISPFAWAPVARKGLRRVGRFVTVNSMQGLDKFRPFTNTHDQLEIYNEMIDRVAVTAGPPLEKATPFEFATRVLAREIVIGPRPADV